MAGVGRIRGDLDTRRPDARRTDGGRAGWRRKEDGAHGDGLLNDARGGDGGQRAQRGRVEERAAAGGGRRARRRAEEPPRGGRRRTRARRRRAEDGGSARSQRGGDGRDEIPFLRSRFFLTETAGEVGGLGLTGPKPNDERRKIKGRLTADFFVTLSLFLVVEIGYQYTHSKKKRKT